MALTWRPLCPFIVTSSLVYVRHIPSRKQKQGPGGASGGAGAAPAPSEPLTLATLQQKLATVTQDIVDAEAALIEEATHRSSLEAASGSTGEVTAGATVDPSATAGEDDLETFMRANEAQRIVSTTAVSAKHLRECRERASTHCTHFVSTRPTPHPHTHTPRTHTTRIPPLSYRARLWRPACSR